MISAIKLKKKKTYSKVGGDQEYQGFLKFLNSMIRVSLIEQMTFEQRFESSNGISQMGIWGKSIENRKNVLGLF